MTPTTFTSVLPSQNTSNFEISFCRLTVEIDKKIQEAIYTVEYKLKKITGNTEDDNWTEGTSATEDKCELISVLGSDGGSIQTQPMPNEGKMAFQIEFLKSLALDEEIEFTIKYKRPILRKEVEGGFLFKRYLVVVESIYANVCRNFDIVFRFENKKCILLESIPNRFQTDNDVITFKKEALRPHEVYTVGLLLHSGFLQRRESKVISSLFLMVVGAFVSLVITKLFG
jgi:hypothetical protein